MIVEALGAGRSACYRLDDHEVGSGRRIPEARGSAFRIALRHFDAELGEGVIVSIDWSDKLRIRLLPSR